MQLGYNLLAFPWLQTSLFSNACALTGVTADCSCHSGCPGSTHCSGRGSQRRHTKPYFSPPPPGGHVCRCSLPDTCSDQCQPGSAAGLAYTESLCSWCYSATAAQRHTNLTGTLILSSGYVSTRGLTVLKNGRKTHRVKCSYWQWEMFWKFIPNYMNHTVTFIQY